MDNNRELENLEQSIQSGLNRTAAATAPVKEEEPIDPGHDVPEQDYPVDESPEEVEKEEVVETKKSPQKSWAELREKAESADKFRRERDEYAAILQKIEREALDYQQRQRAPVKEQEPDDDFDYTRLDDDEILTGKELKRSLSKEQGRLKRIEEELRSQQNRYKESHVESELKAKHADLFDVLTESNISKLREARPSLAKSINMNPDLKEKALDTYQAIKDLGIYQNDGSREDKEKIARNSVKPRTSNSLSPSSGNSPLSKANLYAGELSEETKRSLYKDMLEKAGKV